MTKRERTNLLILTVLVLFIISPAHSVVFPSSFEGNVIIDDLYAEEGLYVRAYIGASFSGDCQTVSISGKTWYFIDVVNGTNGDLVRFTVDGNWADENGTYSIGGSTFLNLTINTNRSYLFSTINVTENVTYFINATNETNVTVSLLVSQNVTNASVNISRYTSNPTNTTFSIPNLGRYIGIDISSEISGNLTFAFLKFFYTDEEVNVSGLNESTLRIYWLNTTTPAWSALNESWSWVYGTGVETAQNYVWANISHFSTFAIGGEELDPEIIYNRTMALPYGWNLISLPLNVSV